MNIFAGMEPVSIPQYLHHGDTVGIIAPARSIREEEILPFTGLLEERGLNVVGAPHLFGMHHQFSGTVEQRLTDLHAMFTDPSVKAIFAARGGYGTAQLLPGIDWEVIRDNPKWLVGFSDITALHAAFGKFMQTLHGVMPYSMAMEEPQDQDSLNQLLKALFGEAGEYSLEAHSFNVPGKAEGAITGGNLSVLYSLSGSPYEPVYEGKILFLEDVDEYLYHVDRMMMNFELRDIFRKISGLVIGSFSGMNDNRIPYGMDALEIIAERANKYNIPALFGFPAGHKKSNWPLIFGRVGTLTVEKGSFSLLKYV
ncbi:MAG: LD-carboxypeptidase [Bacteroidales bacterium]|nr:LD-carboxypeptidase [Bacteroidales bacterium]